MNNRPNFLILLTDQQRFDTISAAGFPHMITPNLDRLAADGCLFEKAYSPNPICVPARHYLLTGNPASEHGYYDNGEHPIKDHALPTLARVFSENGYYTAAIGKCHFHPPKEHHGYSETHLMEELPTHPGEDAYLQFLRSHGHGDARNIHGIRPAIYHEPQAALMPEELLGPTWVSGRAIEWIDENASRPFFLTCGWIKPHPPWNIPENREGLYAERDLPEPIPRSRVAPFPAEDSAFYGDGDTPEEKRRIREAYFTSITMVDEAIGKILGHLERKGLLDNTVIIFTSDHGEMLQDKGFYQKMLPFESSARIPLIIRYPQVFEPGSRSGDLADLMDIFPTCLDLAGITYPVGGNGREYRLAGGSLVPNSTSVWKRDRSVQFCDCQRGAARWVSLRDKRYKFIHFFAGGQEYLYDLEKDPGELVNLIGSSPDHSFIRENLRQKALEFEALRGPGDTLKCGDFADCGLERHQDFGWNNCDKFPRWCFSQFQHFGQTGREAEIFLSEWGEATARMRPGTLAKIPLQPEARRALSENFVRLGGEPAELMRAIENS